MLGTEKGKYNSLQKNSKQNVCRYLFLWEVELNSFPLSVHGVSYLLPKIQCRRNKKNTFTVKKPDHHSWGQAIKVNIMLSHVDDMCVLVWCDGKGTCPLWSSFQKYITPVKPPPTEIKGYSTDYLTRIPQSCQGYIKTFIIGEKRKKTATD